MEVFWADFSSTCRWKWTGMSAGDQELILGLVPALSLTHGGTLTGLLLSLGLSFLIYKIKKFG